jgi:hypothetical protein
MGIFYYTAYIYNNVELDTWTIYCTLAQYVLENIAIRLCRIAIYRNTVFVGNTHPYHLRTLVNLLGADKVKVF